ncbi:universal stress protein [Maribacter arcticus]|uniref:Nucleotide-binding universal stress protein, UspA family n=1 Tax=Maribacter arcticus TaxID=561365 RepID=A0A1T5CIV0_9FLAO|nr:universal stress protein [Maribacter arcticus]SKB59070.1 Nucleotide-binding universal stress protein, UspA family [Maribacter arcticus]
MENVLVPTDFSENSWNALEYAISFFKGSTCNFYLLHVSQINNGQVKAASIGLSLKRHDSESHIPSIERLDFFLRRAQKLPSSKKHRFSILHENGNLIDSIRKLVTEKQIDLIVMGTKGASGIKKLIIGSNTGEVITKVRCNNLVVPEKARVNIPMEIVFATDFNLSYSAAVLETISKVLKVDNAHLRVMNVAQRRSAALTGLQKNNKAYLKGYLDEHFPNSHSFHIITNKKVAPAIDCFVQSWNADMIVMVAKNLNFLQQILFGSTTEQVSFHSKTPFLVIHQ